MKIGLAYWLAHLVMVLLLLKSCLDKSCRTSCLDKSRILLLLKDTVAIVLFVDVVHIDSMDKKSGRVLGDRLIRT